MAENPARPLVLLVITDAEAAPAVSRLLQGGHVPFQYQFRGQGTASSEILSLCGLGETTKALSLSLIPRWAARGLLKALGRELQLKRRGAGIAVTVPVSGLPGGVLRLLEGQMPVVGAEKEKKEGQTLTEQSEYTMILAAVNQGFSDEVMDTAKAAGATGGTILRGRRRGMEDAVRFWGVSLQEEQELLVIVTTREKKREILTALHRNHGPKTPAQGIVLSVPVESAVGLEEP